MEINLPDYLDGYEMKKIAEQEFRDYVCRELADENNLKRLLSNAAYEVVAQFCDTTLDNSMFENIYNNVERVVNELSAFTVFKKPDAWDREPNSMYKFLQECLEKQKPAIEKIVQLQAEVQAMDVIKGEIRTLISDAVQQHYGAL
jgi:hypothetical protein